MKRETKDSLIIMAFILVAFLAGLLSGGLHVSIRIEPQAYPCVTETGRVEWLEAGL